MQVYIARNTELISADDLDKIGELKRDLSNFKRPLVLAGNGIRLSDTQEKFRLFLEQNEIPAVFTYGGTDILDFNHPLHIGSIGVKGTRAGNFAIQNCDILLVLGCCLNIPQIGYMPEKFAPKAKKVVIDVDIENHKKDIGIHLDATIQCRLEEFFNYVLI